MIQELTLTWCVVLLNDQEKSELIVAAITMFAKALDLGLYIILVSFSLHIMFEIPHSLCVRLDCSVPASSLGSAQLVYAALSYEKSLASST